MSSWQRKTGLQAESFEESKPGDALFTLRIHSPSSVNLEIICKGTETVQLSQIAHTFNHSGLRPSYHLKTRIKLGTLANKDQDVVRCDKCNDIRSHDTLASLIKFMEV